MVICHLGFTCYVTEPLMPSDNTLYGRSHQHTAVSDHEYRPLIAGIACLDFVNTVEQLDATPEHDALAPGYANVLAWFAYAGLVEEEATTPLLRLARKQPREAAAVRKRAQALRSAIREVTIACIAGIAPPVESLAVFNDEVHRALTQGSFVAAGDRLRWEWTRTRQLDSPLWPITRSAAGLLSGDELTRVRGCAAADCAMLFLDRSKNGSRRFCSPSGCGNATRVRRFRAIREAAAPPA
jgi:predicted RNA-binding Zn ribbon-like protein